MPQKTLSFALILLLKDFPDLFENETWSLLTDDAQNPFVAGPGCPFKTPEDLEGVKLFFEAVVSSPSAEHQQQVARGRTKQGKKWVPDDILSRRRNLWSGFVDALAAKAGLSKIVRRILDEFEWSAGYLLDSKVRILRLVGCPE